MAKKKKNNFTPKEKAFLQDAKKLAVFSAETNLRMEHVTTPDVSKERAKEIASIQSKLLKQYDRVLVSSGTYGRSKEEVLSDNVIDLSQWEFMEYNNPTEEITATIDSWKKEFIDLPDTEKILFFCPCFKQGTLKITDNRYITWNVLKTDIENHSITMHLTDYTEADDIWEPGTSGTVTVKTMTESNASLESDLSTLVTYSKIFQLLSPKKLGWSKFEEKLWEVSTVYHAWLFENGLSKKDTNPANELGTIFVHNISLVNMALNKSKAKLPQNSRQKYGKDEESKPEIIANGAPSPIRKVRTIKGLQIKSERPPRRPTKQSVIKYSMESWACRGHMRRLKSGRLVPVSPSVHHRKILAHNEQKPPKTTIILKENTPNK